MTSLSRIALAVVILAGVAAAQQTPEQQPQLKTRTEVPASAEPKVPQTSAWVVPAGTKIPIQLRQAVSTKNAQPGDAIYAQTTFPVVVNGQVMIPGGTYVQGVVDSVKRAGRIKGTAELQFHITTLVYPNGYTADLAALIDQVPGDEGSHMKEPGTVTHDSEKGKDLERVGRGASEGATIGTTAGLAIHPTLGGFRAGSLTGLAAGTMIAMLARGSDVRFATGTVVDVVLNHAIKLDREQVMRPAVIPAYYPQPVYLPPPPSEPPSRR